MSARLTALTKPDGGIRGIATGCELRRLVARILARQCMKEFESECAPFQYALSTRAGSYCVEHLLRAATDADPQATILSVDGVGAYDHVLRFTMLERLMHMPTAQAMLPFVRLSYGTPSRYSWVDADGRQRFVTQAEGGEQGDPLMPLLFSIGIHGALEEVASSIERGEQLCAFLDDIYVLCAHHRVVPLFKQLSESLERVAGIRLHQGKTRVWNAGGIPPEDVLELGRDAWQSHGLKVLGTPVGTRAFTSEKLRERVAEERQLWNAIPHVKDLQYSLPSLSSDYAQEHDDGIWETVVALLQQVPGGQEERQFARALTTLPMRMGGLGMRSATRCAAAAYWASWADALPMIGQRNPEVAETVVRTMEGEQQLPDGGCMAELAAASSQLDREVFWLSKASGSMAGSIGRLPFLTHTSGRQPCCWPAPPRLVPTSGHTQATTQAPPWLTRPLPRSTSSLRICSGCCFEAVCSGCRAPLDPLGRHRAACPRTGRLRKRASPTERMLARVCREASARVRFNAFLRNMNVNVAATDERRIEVLAQDLPCFGGAQLAVDITLRCVLSSVGEPHSNTADVDGAALMVAREDKERIYPELTMSGRCRLVVVAIETGGRWSTEAVDFVRQLSFAKAWEAPSFMQFSTALAWERRWTRMLSTVCSLSFAASLVEPSDTCASWCWTGGEPPPLADLLEQDPR